MKSIKSLATAVTILAACSTAIAGNLGPGPWANGAYYPGQYDGVYTASIYGGSPGVVSGVLGFGLRNGAPSTTTSSNSSTTSGFFTGTTTTSTSLAVDPTQNYYVVYVDGQSYAGTAVANFNQRASAVAGALSTGSASPTTEFIYSTNTEINNSSGTVTTNITVDVTTVTLSNTCGGAFSAKMLTDKAVIAFKGEDTGTIATSVNGVPASEYTFSVNGTKVGN